jgi:hypothetical protein|tara:strand:- start:1065 stop:1364 length:300 start_codon:yes stop_codon:yes gene_type:complete
MYGNIFIMADKKGVVTTEDLKNAEVEAPPVAKAAPKKAAAPSGDQMLFMRHGYGYSIGEVDFTRDHPYQLVGAKVAKQLLATTQFEVATQAQVKEHYGE